MFHANSNKRDLGLLYISDKVNYVKQLYKRKEGYYILINELINQEDCCSVIQSCLTFATPCTAARQASLSFTVSQSLLKLLSTELMPSNHLICRPLLLMPSVFPSIRVFSSESTLHIRWPKYWSFSFRISPSNEYSGLISFRIDWFVLLAVQGTLKSLLQHHSLIYIDKQVN